MGICYIKSISDHATLGLWHVTEQCQDLQEMISLPAHDLEKLNAKRTEKRKLEWLVCRVLLKEMIHIEPVVYYDENRKPHLENDSHQISMSHSGDYVSVYVHERMPVGVDLQLMKPSISKGADYFLNAEEQDWTDLDDNLLLHLIWSAKEAAFKYAGDPDLDLKKHIITKPFSINQNGLIEVSILKNTSESIHIRFDTFENYVLTWTV